MNNLGTWIDWQYMQNAAKLLAKVLGIKLMHFHCAHIQGYIHSWPSFFKHFSESLIDKSIDISMTNTYLSYRDVMLFC